MGRPLAAAAAAFVLSAGVAGPAGAAGPITDPIPQQPIQSSFGLVLAEVAVFPKSEPTPPPSDGPLMRHARINAVVPLPDGSGRLAVPDLNGTLYLLDGAGGAPRVYLDVAAAFAPRFFSGRGLGQGFGYVAFHPEFGQLGMRDPHRFSWDPGDGNRMFLGHIGEHTIEAIYDVRAGDNLGWSEREGAFVFDRRAADPCARILPLPPDDARYGYTYPVAAYDHDPPPTWDCTSPVGRAVAGGFVYRGAGVPALRGKYVFGDIVDGRVFYTEADQMRRGRGLAPLYQLMLYDTAGRRVTMPQLSSPGSTGDPRRVDLRFGRDAAGELYLLAKANGKVWRVVGARLSPAL